MMQRLKVWIKAIRAPFFTATIVPVTLGSAVAWHKMELFNWAYFWLTLIGTIFMNMGTNLTNDYFDHTSGNDEINRNPTAFSGGSRVIQDKLIEPKKVLCGALLSFALGAIIGLYLNYACQGNIILLLGLVGLFIGFFYTADPLRIGYTGLGELVVGLGFGPLVVLGSYYVQAQELSWAPFFASIPVGILIALVLYINEFPDYDADKEVGKRTLIVILGKRRAIRLYFVLLGLSYLSIILGVIFKSSPPLTLITILTLPLCFKAMKVARKNFDKTFELLPANATTIGLHLMVGLLLSGGYILDKIVKW